MPSRPASINLFFKSNGLPNSFHPIIPIFGVNIVPKDVEEEFLFFASNFNGSFISKIGKKIWIFKVFGHFLKKFSFVKNDPRGPNFRVPNKVKIGQYIGFRLFSWNLSAIFTLNLIYKFIGSTFVGVKKRGTRGLNFGPFWASKWVKIQAFEYFVDTLGLDSHQSCFICALELLSDMCKIWASKAQFLCNFGPKSKKNFWCLVIFSKSFHWFYNSIASHAHPKYF